MPTTFYEHLHAHDVDSILKISCMIILFDHKKKEYLQTNEVITTYYISLKIWRKILISGYMLEFFPVQSCLMTLAWQACTCVPVSPTAT